MFWPVSHVSLASGVLVLLLCDIRKIPVLIAFPITILVAKLGLLTFMTA